MLSGIFKHEDHVTVQKGDDFFQIYPSHGGVTVNKKVIKDVDTLYKSLNTDFNVKLERNPRLLGAVSKADFTGELSE
jgi:hypothetical protein